MSHPGAGRARHRDSAACAAPPLTRLAAQSWNRAAFPSLARRSSAMRVRRGGRDAAVRMGARDGAADRRRRAPDVRADRRAKASRRGIRMRVAMARDRAFARSSRRRRRRERSSTRAAAHVRRRCGNVLDDARGRWLFDADAQRRGKRMGARRRRRRCDRRTWCSTGRSSPTACAGSSTSRRSRTKARDVERSSIARRSAIASSSSATHGSIAALDARPIRLGLYFPLLRGWREWRVSRRRRSAARRDPKIALKFNGFARIEATDPCACFRGLPAVAPTGPSR